VNKNILLQPEIFRNIRAAFTTTVYAFLNPGRPSAAWDFFCLEFRRSRLAGEPGCVVCQASRHRWQVGSPHRSSYRGGRYADSATGARLPSFISQ
jgi:hypothetical protein